MFDVGCSMLNVPPGSWEASTIPASRIEAMNPPPTPPEEGSQCRGTLASSPPGRGQGWVGSWKVCRASSTFDHLQKLLLVDNLYTELLSLLQLRPGLFAREDVIGLLAH